MHASSFLWDYAVYSSLVFDIVLGCSVVLRRMSRDGPIPSQGELCVNYRLTL